MDSSWQVKCSSILQSSVSAMASSTSHEARDQLEMIYAYSHAGQELRTQNNPKMPNPPFHNIAANLSSCSSSHVDLGSSFVSLLSGPTSLSHFDFQEFSNPKVCNTFGKLPSETGNITVSSIGSQIPVISGGLISGNPSYRNLQSRADLCSIVSSRAVASSNSVFQHGLPAVNTSFQGSDFTTTISHQPVLGNEKIKDFASLKGELYGMPLADVVKLQNVNGQIPQTFPPKAESSALNNSSTSVSGCPRVFCLDRSGDLLLSNTGLLGILCSCHCFHMSVSKFCEHSGLQNVNPGDAVHMDSGETIAQWRKLYYQKFGIRVPEDETGWDWPEGLSLTASLVKSGMTMSNIVKNHDRSNLVGASGVSVRSGQPSGDVFPKDFLSNQISVIDALRDRQQRKGQDCNEFYLKGLAASSQRNSCSMRDNHLTDCSISRCMPMPKFIGRGSENIHQFLHTKAIPKSGSLGSMHQPLRNHTTAIRNSSVSRSRDACSGANIDREASSSIELKLGQPYQQSQSPGGPVLPSVGQFYNMLVNSQRPFSQERMIHNVTDCRGQEESGIFLPCSVGLSTPRREQEHLSYGNRTLNNIMDAAKSELFMGNAVKPSVVLPFKQCTLPQGNLQSKTTSNLFNVSDHVRLDRQHYESHAKSDSVNATWNSGNGLERHCITQSGFHKPVEKGKGVGYVSKSCTETTSGSKMHNCMENTSSSADLVGANTSVFPLMHDQKRHSCYFSNVTPDAQSSGKFSSCPESVLCFGSSRPTDHVLLRSMGSTVPSGKPQSSQAASTESPFYSSTSIPVLSTAMANQASIGTGPYLHDDKLRLLALGQILGLSKQQHAFSSFGNNLEQGKCSNSFDVKVQHSFVEPSVIKEQWPAHDFNRKQDIAEVSMELDKSASTSKMVNNVDKLSSVTGFNRCCNFSTLTQGMPLHCGELGMHSELSQSLQTERSPLRLGRCQSNISHSNERESCCPRTLYFQYNCSCAARNCIGGHCNLGARSPPNSLRDGTGSFSCKTPMLLASQFAGDDVNPKQNAFPFEQCGTIKGQPSKNNKFGASQWKDVPRKENRVMEKACVKSLPEALDGRGCELGQLEDNPVKCSNGPVHVAHSKEQEQDISNISSGCSTPAVTQVSIEATTINSSTVVGNAEYANNLVVDEGSGIDKCWSSDDAFESDRSADFCGSSCKENVGKDGFCKVFGNKPFRSLLDEVKLMDSLTWKKGQNQKQCGVTDYGITNQSHLPGKGMKTGKRKREMEMKMLDTPECATLPDLRGKNLQCDITSDRPCLSKNLQIISSAPDLLQKSDDLKINPKCGNSALSVTKGLSHKRDVHGSYSARDGENDCQTKINHNGSCCQITGISGRRKFRSTQTADVCLQFQMQKNETASCSKAKPVVCGNYGEIINGNVTGEVANPVKIVSLEKILKTAKRCSLPKKCKPGLKSSRGWNRRNFSRNNECSDGLFNLTKEEKNNRNVVSAREDTNIKASLKERDYASASGDEQSAGESSMLEKNKCINDKGYGVTQDANALVQTKPKHKETRKRSLYELTVKGKDPCPKMVSPSKVFTYEPKMKMRKIQKNYDRKWKCQSVTDIDPFCCVCGRSNEDEVNCLLECGRCTIRVHQACYGVSRVPKGHWYCRPCRANSKNIVCVLCGYGGGAMTQALKSRAIVKTLLKAWNLETECRPSNRMPSYEIVREQFSMMHPIGSMSENIPCPVVRPTNIETSTSTICNMDVQHQSDLLQNSSCHVSNLKMHNSITAGVLDSTVKQWIHMVCGLWTPGTRCPNVDTMSAFDVSGASCPGTDVVCSLCNRPGGSCIQCRVEDCSVQFHPWCAHQKGLLQSEAEGIDNESVGFYGKCVHHAICPANEPACHADEIEADCKSENCARTEGYKGRKGDGFWHNNNCQSKGKGCLVPQEQLNAWIHINGQKSCSKGLFKPPISEKESDCRKEYARYKQTKGWKHLVVYKSGIHALGLYTSQFISRGEMVVEYVGEIVGLRVADKRENEYMSGRKVQYKSACYFFRIDKEHIIDATRKGGIARFVNHSCLPNCVAKIISVRTEKKVVFFAERDIYPGEEITYDYHFNNEDEGKKIPCFCNSKNCRRYLN